MLTIHEAAGAIRQRKLTPVELLDQCLERIDRYEPKVRAWVFVARDEAREQAEALTKELEGGHYRGPLHGIPIGVKDIFDVFDWPTAAGSKLWANSIARRDSTAVERLRQAGAVFVGKTVTTAYASFDPPVTRNPWNLERTPGGSSSGSAAAVACGMCLGALASQTGGSITRPASFCGVASIKPTYGRVSAKGVLPLAWSMDHVGAMANCVRDLAILFSVICDERRDFGAALGRQIDPPNIAVLGGLFNERPTSPMRELVQKVAESVRIKGASVGTIEPPPEFNDVLNRHGVIMDVEAASFHEARFQAHPEDYPPRITDLIRRGLTSRATEYARSLQHRPELTNSFHTLLPNSTQFLLTPAALGAAPPADTTGDPAFNSPWSYTGMPTVSLPAGWTADGLPLSIQLVGRYQSEEDLVRAAAWCEQAIGFERRPIPL